MEVYFATMTMGELGTVLGIVFGAFGAILVGFYKYAQAREKDFEKSRQIAAKAYDKSTKALSKSLDRVAHATERAADEAKQRNGHLGELLVQNNETIIKLADRNLKAYQNVKTQNVGTQNVKTATVDEEVVEHETKVKK